MSQRHVEVLERRDLRAADLAVRYVSGGLPESVVVGLRRRTTVKLAVSRGVDDGTAALGAVPVTVSLRAPDGSLRQAGATSVRGGQLKAGATRVVSVRVEVPADVAAGSYELVGTVVPGPGAADPDASNDSTVFGSVRVELPSANLVVSATSTLAGAVEPATPGSVSVAVRNAGNMPARGTARIDVVATYNGRETVLVTVPKVWVGLAPGKAFSVRPIKFLAPGHAGAEAAVAVSTRLTMTSGQLTGDVAGDNTAPATDLLVSPPPTSTLAAVDLGDRLTLKAGKVKRTTSAGLVEDGKFLDPATGRSGTYSARLTQSGEGLGGPLTLRDAGGSVLLSARLTVYWAVKLRKLGGRTVAFGADPTAASGDLLVGGAAAYFAFAR